MAVNTRIKLKRDTTAHWNSARGFVPLEGELILYMDGRKELRDGVEVNVPTIKIGDGLAYVQDLPFVDEDTRTELLDHINNLLIHVSSTDRHFWNDKVNIDDVYEQLNEELEDETLVFSRSFVSATGN